MPNSRSMVEPQKLCSDLARLNEAPAFGDQFYSAGLVDLHASIATFPQGGYGRFNHTEPSVTYVESGHVWFAMHGFSGWISGGSLVVMPAGVRTVCAGSQTRGISVGLGRSQLSARHTVQASVVPLSPRARRRWFDRTLALAERPISDRSELVESLEAELADTVEAREKRRAGLVANLLKTIERSSRRVLPLRELSERFGYAPNHLNDIVSLNTGRSIRQWEIGFRLEAARRLLKRGDLSIGDVAAEIAMDAPHFTRMFRNHFDLTPSAWRASVAGGNNFEPFIATINSGGIVRLTNDARVLSTSD